MKIRIKRIDKDLPLPRYESNGAVAFDLVARESVKIKPGMVVRIPMNIVVETPPGYMLLITPRSSMPIKKPNLLMPHSVGIIDQDYCGSNDEIQCQVQNMGEDIIRVERGEKLQQAMFVRVDKAEFEEVEEIASTSRGGFGSTDK